jgi:hypothetical protein
MEKSEEQELKKDREGEAGLPYCTSAPSAEHARAYDEDEPCDDSRAWDKDTDQQEDTHGKNG